MGDMLVLTLTAIGSITIYLARILIILNNKVIKIETQIQFLVTEKYKEKNYNNKRKRNVQ